MGIKEERELVIKSGSPLRHHHLSQAAIKRSLEGERRLGIFPSRSKRSNDVIEEQLSMMVQADPRLQYMRDVVQELDQNNQPIPLRMGKLSLIVSSFINQDLKTDPQNFIEEFSKAKKFKFLHGTPFENLFPINKMAANYLTKDGYMTKDTHQIQQTYASAKNFAQNLGGIIFNQGEQMTMLSTLIALNNLSIYFAKEIDKHTISVTQARKQIIAFGTTAANELAKM